MTAIAFAGTKFVADTGLVNRDYVVGETNKIVVESISSYHVPECPAEGSEFLGVLVFAVAGDINMRAIASRYIRQQLQMQLSLPIYRLSDLRENSVNNPFEENSGGVAVYVSPEGQIRSFYVTSDGMTENTMHDCIAASYGTTYFMLGVALGEDLESLMARVVGRTIGIGPNYQVVDVIEALEKAKSEHPVIVESGPDGYTVVQGIDAAKAYQKEKDMREKPPIEPPPLRVVKDPEVSCFRPFWSLWKILTGRWNDL